MNVKPFELERWQSVWENKVELNISESGVHPLTTAELVPDAETLRRILDVPQGYPQTNGSEELRSRISELYPGAQVSNVLLTCGGSEANFISTWMLLEPGDEVVFMLPNYMQISGLATAFGALVKPLWLREKLNWGIDIDELAHLITAKTKLIAICNPNNPTGAVLRREKRGCLLWFVSIGFFFFSGRTFESVQPAGTAHGLGCWSHGDHRAAMELSRLHEHRPDNVDGPTRIRGTRGESARRGLESPAQSPATELSSPPRMARRSLGLFFAHRAESGSDCLGRIAPWRQVCRYGRSAAREEKRSYRARGADGNGFVRAIWLRRRSGAFAEGARTNRRLDERIARLGG